ncbi:uncharacterized protein LOC122054069 [Zingiber officinale]|uniref:uncharacterized protein LOC122054069 n=1 Tax=Zingiber officinale TaxID=94328 RepID=UPI001C4B1455|nr:uncharacterized protein LOC122054069 [Zingiber officinale]
MQQSQHNMAALLNPTVSCILYNSSSINRLHNSEAEQKKKKGAVKEHDQKTRSAEGSQQHPSKMQQKHNKETLQSNQHTNREIKGEGTNHCSINLEVFPDDDDGAAAYCGATITGGPS